jgi:hypothetical protein
MKHLLTLIIGIATGMYLHAQNKAIHIPVIHSIDPVVLMLMLIVIIAIVGARRKNMHRGNRK